MAQLLPPPSGPDDTMSEGCQNANFINTIMSGSDTTRRFPDGVLGPSEYAFAAGEKISISITVTYDGSGGGSFSVLNGATEYYSVSSGSGPLTDQVFTGEYTVTGSGDLALHFEGHLGNGTGTGLMFINVRCTPVTASSTGTITIVKNTVGGNGTFSFTGDLDAFDLTTTGGTASTTFSDLAPGPYDVTEAEAAGFDLTGLVCDDGSTTSVGTATATIDLAADENVTCTFTNTAQGSITITKTSIGGDAKFSFTGDLDPFDLTTSGGTASTTFSNLTPGTYGVTETAAAGFDLTGLVCDDSSTTSVGTATATIELAAGENVICTFTNTSRGTVTIDVTTNGGDGDFGFTGDLGAFAITSVSGAGSSGFPDLAPNTYAVTAAINTTFVLNSIVCVDTDSGSTTNLPSRTATIDLDAGEAIVCTFDYTEVTERTAAIINDFMTNRANTLLDAGPTLRHYLDRFDGTPGDGFTFAPLAYQEIPVGGGGAAFDALLTSPDTHWALWADGTYERYREGGPGTQVNGNVAAFQAGIDYLFGDRLIVGFTAEGDAARELSNDLGYKVEGLGWMVGPYGALRLGDRVVFDAKFLWGRSGNDIQPFLTYTDQFTTTRWLATARLSGEATIGVVSVRPEAYFAYFTETQHEYVDTNGITIPEQTINVGRLTFGPEFAITMPTASGGTIEPRLSFEGVWDIFSADLSARLSAGLQFTGPQGASLLLRGGYGGLFNPAFRNWNVGANFTIPLH